MLRDPSQILKKYIDSSSIGCLRYQVSSGTTNVATGLPNVALWSEAFGSVRLLNVSMFSSNPISPGEETPIRFDDWGKIQANMWGHHVIPFQRNSRHFSKHVFGVRTMLKYLFF